MGSVKLIEALRLDPRAKIVFVPCLNCIDQILDLIKEYEIDAKAVHFKEYIAELMVIPEEMIPKEEEE